MSIDSGELLSLLLRATLGVTLAACATLLVFRIWKTASLRMHRIAWAIVIVQGIMFVRLPVHVPLLPENSPLAKSWLLGEGWLDPSPAELAFAADAASPGQMLNDVAEPNLETTQVPSERSGNEAAAKSVGEPRFNPTAITAAFWIWPTVLLGLWLSVVMGLILAGGARYLRLLRLVQGSDAPPLEWDESWRRLQRRIGVLGRPIPMRITRSFGPALCLLPSGYTLAIPERYWQSLSVEQRESILLHELAHWSRRDIAKSFLVRLLVLPQWFNPFAWLAVRRFDECAEWACDAAVMRSGRRHAQNYARALVALVDGTPRPSLGTSMFRGSPFKVRIMRLLEQETRTESPVRRLAIGFSLMLIFAIGAMSLDVVQRTVHAQEDETTAADEMVGRDFDDQIQRWATQLAPATSADPVYAEFVQRLEQRPGRIAVANRLALIEEEMRQTAAANALPEFLEQHFERRGDQYELRAEKSNFAARLTRDAGQFDEDVDRLQQAIAEIASRFKGESEADQLLARALENELVPALLYVRQLRETMRPDVRVIQRRLAEAFAIDRDGQYFIREQAKEGVQRLIEQLQRAEKLMPLIQNEFHLLSKELAERDDLHRELKTRLASENSGALVALELANPDQINPDEVARNYLRNLDQMFIDESDGLVIQDESRERLVQAMQRSAETRQRMELLEQPFAEFVERIDEQHSPLDAELKTLLQSPLGLTAIASRVPVGQTDIEPYIQNVITQAMDVDEQGGLSVREDRQEAVARFAQDLLRGARELRRQLQTSHEVADQLADPQLKQILSSLSGRFIVREMITGQLANQRFDALAQFSERFFEQTANGWQPKEDALPLLQEINSRAQQIEQELANDDF